MSIAVREASLSEGEMIAQAESALADIKRVREGVGRVIFGQESVVERTLVALLAGGHALLVGVPGLAKTKLVETLGIVLGLLAGGLLTQFRHDGERFIPMSTPVAVDQRPPMATVAEYALLREGVVG